MSITVLCSIRRMNMKRYILLFSAVLLFLCSCNVTVTNQILGISVGEQLMADGKNEEALSYYEKELEQNIQKYGPQSPQVASNYNNMSIITIDLENYEKSLELISKAIIINETLGNDKALAANYINMGEAYFYLENYSYALDCYNQSLKRYRKFYGEGSQEVINATYAIANTYKKMGDYDIAINLLKDIAGIDRNQNGVSSESLRYTYKRLADIYLLLEDSSNTEKYSLMAINSNTHVALPDLKLEADMHGNIAKVFYLKDPEKSNINCIKALEFYGTDDNEWVSEQIILYRWLAQNYKSMERYQEAQEYCVKVCYLAERKGSEAEITEEDIKIYKGELEYIYNELSHTDSLEFDKWYQENVLKK